MLPDVHECILVLSSVHLSYYHRHPSKNQGSYHKETQADSGRGLLQRLGFYKNMRLKSGLLYEGGVLMKMTIVCNLEHDCL